MSGELHDEELRLPDLAIVAAVAILDRAQAKGEKLTDIAEWFARLVWSEVEKADRHAHANTEGARMLSSPALPPPRMLDGDPAPKLEAEATAAAGRIGEGLRAGLESAERRSS